MIEQNKQTKKKWKFLNSRIILLSIFIFLTSYFPIVMRFNINTLFNVGKRGYFNFLFWNIDLGMDRTNLKSNQKIFNWTFCFSLLMFLVYWLERISNIFSDFYKEKSKSKLEKTIIKKIPFFNDCNSVKSFSSEIVDSYSIFFFNVCELIIEIWSAIKINLARSIKPVTWKQCLFCLLLIFIWYLGLKMFLSVIKLSEKSKDKRSVLFHVNHKLNELKFSNLNVLFFVIYFLIISKDYEFAQSELINIILLAGNIQVILNKSLKFVRTFPQLKTTYSVWKSKNDLFLKHIG